MGVLGASLYSCCWEAKGAYPSALDAAGAPPTVPPLAPPRPGRT